MSLNITLLYATSADGFIATKEHQGPWLSSSWEYYVERCREVGHLIMGYRTFELFKGDPNVNQISFASITVLSRSISPSESGVTFVTSPLEAAQHLSGRGVRRAVLMGGSVAATRFLEAGLLSEIHIDRNPIVLGDGIPMFQHLPTHAELRLQSCSGTVDGRIIEVYEVASRR